MNKPVILLCLGLVAYAFCQPAAFADPKAGTGSFKIDKDALPDGSKIERARKQIQILDTGPIISDLRRPKQAPDQLIINLGPQQAVPGNTYVYGDPQAGGGQAQAIPLGNSARDLPNAGFTRYFDPNKASRYSNLPGGGTVGVHPTNNSPVAHKFVSGSLHPNQLGKTVGPELVSAKGYQPYTGGAAGGGNAVNTSVSGKVYKSPLINKLKGN